MNNLEMPDSTPSIKAWLERWVWIYDIFGFVILSGILKYHTNWSEFFQSWTDLFSLQTWTNYFAANGLIPILGVEIIALFYLGKAFAKSNIDMLVDLFSSDRIPQEMQMLKDRRQFATMLIINFSQFVILESIINLPWFFAIVLFTLYAFYLWFNSLQRGRIWETISDPIFLPRDDDPHKPFIEHRRNVAHDYLFNKPHTKREVAVAVASVVAFVLTLWQIFGDLHYGSTAAYMLLVTAIFFNEIIVGRWRRNVFRQLDEINTKQIRDDIRRAESRRRSIATGSSHEIPSGKGSRSAD